MIVLIVIMTLMLILMICIVEICFWFRNYNTATDSSSNVFEVSFIENLNVIVLDFTTPGGDLDMDFALEFDQSDVLDFNKTGVTLR